MTVINVTDATLKGDVAGPTFTGKVDGSKFSGSVTYTDTTTPPVEPPPSGDQPGTITNFTAANGQQFRIDDTSVKNDNANKAWCLQSPDNHTLRVEVRSRDCWTSADGGYSDGNNAERCEVSWSSSQYPNGTTVTLNYRLTVLEGPPNRSQWLVLTQAHDTSDGTPPFAIELADGNDRMQIKVRYKPRGGSKTEKVVYKDPNNIQRGHTYEMKTQLKYDPEGNGFVNVWRDGVQIVNYRGAVGIDGQKNYFKLGVYRNPTSETIAVTFGNILHTSP